MPAPLITKDQAVNSLFATFRDLGYGGATLSELSRGTGLGRSSLYHHFPGGKEDMAAAVMSRAEAFLQHKLAAAVNGEGTPQARLATILDALDALYAGGKNPCVLASFTQGEARTLFQRQLIALFDLWIEGFAALARDAGVPARQARDRAEDAVGALEGSLILSAGLNDITPFRRRLAAIPANCSAPRQTSHERRHMNGARLASVHVGRIAPLGPEGEPSGFVKRAVAGAVQVGTLGLAGDEQADLRVHGGPEKAVYGYAISHYPAWRSEFPDLADLFVPGGVGENLAIDGLDETGIHVGDVHSHRHRRIAGLSAQTAMFQVLLRFGNNRLPKAMVRSGRSGWYYRVLKHGLVAAGDAVTLMDRPNPDFPFTRLLDVVNFGRASVEELQKLAAMPGLAGQWRAQAAQLLQQTQP